MCAFCALTQFPEDSGPLAHPIRPDSYQEISNFYTSTIYNKGAEVIRMMRTMVGPERFRQGTDLYFDRHDGQPPPARISSRRSRTAPKSI